jgi:hypothetical protein
MVLSVGVKIGIVAFGVLVAAAAYEAFTHPEDPPEVVTAQNAVAQDLARQMVDALPADAHWSGVTIDEAKSGVYRLTLHYPPDIVASPEIAADTKVVAQTMLLQLSMSGHHPNDERTVISVTAQAGADGASLSASHFDPGADRIVPGPQSP